MGTFLTFNASSLNCLASCFILALLTVTNCFAFCGFIIAGRYGMFLWYHSVLFSVHWFTSLECQYLELLFTQMLNLTYRYGCHHCPEDLQRNQLDCHLCRVSIIADLLTVLVKGVCLIHWVHFNCDCRTAVVISVCFFLTMHAGRMSISSCGGDFVNVRHIWRLSVVDACG